MPGLHANRDLQRAQRAITRGLEALGRRVPSFTAPVWDSDAEDLRVWDERKARARIEALDGGRDLIARAAELERQADAARRAGVEALRHAWPAEPWPRIGELLGMSGQGAHKRYRDVAELEPELTIDDELALSNGHRNLP